MNKIDLYKAFSFASPTSIISAIELGFEQIYLLGTDFGYISKINIIRRSVYYENK